MMPMNSAPTGVGFLNSTSKPLFACHSFAPPTQFQLSSTDLQIQTLPPPAAVFPVDSGPRGVAANGEIGRAPPRRLVVVVRQPHEIFPGRVDGQPRVRAGVIG